MVVVNGPRSRDYAAVVRALTFGLFGASAWVRGRYGLRTTCDDTDDQHRARKGGAWGLARGPIETALR